MNMFDRAIRAWSRTVTPTTNEPFYSAESLARRLPRNRPLATILWEAAHDAGVPLNFKQADALAAAIIRKGRR